MRIVLKEFSLGESYLNCSEGLILEINEEDIVNLIVDKIGNEVTAVMLKNNICLIYKPQEIKEVTEEIINRINMVINKDLIVLDNCIFVSVDDKNKISSLTETQIEILRDMEILRRKWNVECKLYKGENEVFSKILEVEALHPHDALFMADDLADNMFYTFESLDAGMFVGSKVRNIEYVDKNTGDYFDCVLHILY